jgi:succinate-semialdehyde dehydrogenase/glutarate-semialdehyde dehydrogenase
MQIEAGFPISDGKREMERAAETFYLSADAAIRFSGESVPLGSAPGANRRIGITIRKPVGTVAAITPFNAPVNTPAHKVGPALAAGNAVILKPAETTPSVAVALADILAEAGLPAPWLHVLHGQGQTVGAKIVADPRVDFIAFTGSTATGRAIHAAAGLRRTQLELGSIACTAIANDALIDNKMITGCASAAFRKAGQVCTSIQRLYVHQDVELEVTDKLVAAAKAMGVGDPSNSNTQVGPLITRRAAERVEAWIKEAVSDGAELVLGGTRNGTVIDPTILRGVRPGMRLHDEEAFGPVLCLYPFDSDEELIEAMNSTEYGLAAGLFTRSVDRAMNFAQRLRVGTLHVNGTSSNRVDIMPYGGVKDSGHGLEGPAYAVNEMSEETLLSIEWNA